VRWNEFRDGQKKQTHRRTPPEHRKGPVMKSSQTGSAPSGFFPTITFALPAVALLLLAAPAPMRAGTDNRAPEVPASLAVPDGNKVSFHAYAVGVQIYTATNSATSPTGFAWTFHAPEAVLFDADGNVVGRHYAFAGPTRPAWE